MPTPPPEMDLTENEEGMPRIPRCTEDELQAVNEKDGLSATESDAPTAARRRGRPPKGKRKRGLKQDELPKAAPPRKVSKVANQFREVLERMEKKKARIRECEKEVAKADEDLREIESARTRCLGKDRFWNRYWLLERNAMPWAGLPNSSTADAEYANGCLWVQGPDDLERTGFVEVGPEEERKYRRTFQMTVAERKRLEEGPTSLITARHWGFYDEPDQLDMLIGWLNHRGHRELKLRKELQNFRGRIIALMEKRKAYLNVTEKKDLQQQKADDEAPIATTATTTRMSTRTKNHHHQQQQGEQALRRCQRWKNTMALREIGHLHSDEPQTRKGVARRKTNRPKDSPKATGTAPGTRTNSRPGRPLTRQGTRHNF